MLLRTVLTLLALSTSCARADVRLPAFWADHMVLQRGVPIVVHGTATPGEAVAVAFADQGHATLADGDGRWQVVLEPLEASAEGRPLVVRGASDVVTLDDVVVGEVWLCSGQSNMVWRVEQADGADVARAGASDPRLRMFTAAAVSTAAPQEDLPGSWEVQSAETVERFSATAYYFGRELLETLDVPVGLVVSAWGGSSVEAWTSMASLEATPAARATLDAWAGAADAERVRADLWAGPDLDTSAWETADLPASFAELGHDIDGVIWFRRAVELPEAWRGRALVLELGAIDDDDHTFADGELIGSTSDWQARRRYAVPAEATVDGRVVLAVRVLDRQGAGGFHGDDAGLRLFPEGREAEALDLDGAWRARVTSISSGFSPQHRPAHLYRGMLHPLRRFAVRGALWYQGENNAQVDRADAYGALLPAFVRDLRALLERPELPVGIVQLPGFGANDDTYWRFPLVREAQLAAARSLDGVGLAVTLDLGELDDIHPANKLDVGRRLARWALVDVYGALDGPATGPLVRDVAFDGDAATVTFDTGGSSLATRDGEPPAGFELAGADRTFHPAEATLSGGRVELRASAVPAPVAARYAFANSPLDANLVNSEGLPASPFRTDHWTWP